MSLYIAKVRLRKSQYPHWFNSDLRHRHKCLRTLCRRFSRHPSPSLSVRLHSTEESFQRASLLAKAWFEEDLILKLTYSGENSVFSYISSLCKGGSIPSAVFYDSVSASTDDERVTLFNVYFNSVFTRSSFLALILRIDTILSSIDISEDNVFDCLSTLDVTKATFSVPIELHIMA